MKRVLLPLLTAAIFLPLLPVSAKTTTKEAGATTIHEDGYQCSSFEGDYGQDGYDSAKTGSSQEDLLAYAILASSAYIDRNDADGHPDRTLQLSHGETVVTKSDPGMNHGQGRVDNWKLLGDGYKEMDAGEVRNLLGGEAGTLPGNLKVHEQTLHASETSVGQEAKSEKDKVRSTADQWNDIDVVTVTGSDENALNVRIFEGPDGEIILSFRGSAGGKDIRDDIKQVSHLAPTPQQYKDAAAILGAVLDNPAYKDRKVVCTGHSLGGGLVQYAMAANDIMDSDGKSRVSGYTFNSAGLNGLETVNSFSTEKAQNAAANIIGVRNDADPVSFVGYHLLQEKKMYEVKTDLAFSAEHSIKELIRNMAASMPAGELTDKVVDDVDRAEATRQQQKRDEKAKKTEAKTQAKAANNQGGPTGGAAPVTQSASHQGNASAGQGSHTGGVTLPYSLETFLQNEISSNQDVQDAFDDAFDKVRIGLDTVLPASTAKTVADKLEELAKKGVVAAGGAVDKAVQAQIDKLKAEILSHMPGDASKEQMGKLIDDMLAGVGSGNFSAFGADAADLGVALAGDYASKLVDGLNLPPSEKAALKKTVSDAVQAYIKGTGVGASIKGNIESYVYGKIKGQFGQEVADAWKKAYQTWQGGKNPWADIGAAAKKTIESWAFQKLEKVIDASLKKLLSNHPVLAEVFKALGIDTKSIMGTIKNIWGVLTGPGDFSAKLQKLADLAVQGLANMLKSLVDWGLKKLQAWLNGFMSKIGKAISNWIRNLLGNTFHLSQTLVDKAMKAVDAAIGAGAKYVAALPLKLEKPIGSAIDKGAQKIRVKINGGAQQTTTTPPKPPVTTRP